MNNHVTVFVRAVDPISEAGIAAQLRGRPGIRVSDDPEDASVALVVVDEVDDDNIAMMRSLHRTGALRVVVVAGKLDEAAMLQAIEAGACGFLRRSHATPEQLSESARAAAAGDGNVPADLLGRLLDQVGRMQRQVLAPRGLTMSGLTEREIDVLRLVAVGLDTGEIADELSWSERTIKNVIHDVTSRLNLRNRSHAVAYALRAGLI